MMTATYSPEDNKLRLYSDARLGSDTYARVKAAGFKWAPKQDLFVAPLWTPEREDLLLSLCDEIGDEDTGLVERAESRADRFEDYSDKRERDAHSAKAAVDQLADGIPLGQPILVGHHSERRARKDAERIERGMRRAVQLWRTVEDNWGNGGANFTRTIPFDKLSAVMSKEQVDAARVEGRIHEGLTGFYLDAPAETRAEASERVHREATQKDESDSAFSAMAESLRAGVQVVTAPNLFPTPPDVAARLVELAEIDPAHRVLEPSAGTGNILKAIGPGPDKVAVEINGELVRLLASGGAGSGTHIVHDDFLALNGDLGTFDRVVMNPPFDHGSDIRHVEHALSKLNPGGRLVAVVANGPKQQERLQPLASAWIDLPDGTFTGTGVRTAIVVIDN